MACKTCGTDYTIYTLRKHKLPVIGFNQELNHSSPPFTSTQYIMGCECWSNTEYPNWFLFMNIAALKEAVDAEYNRLAKLVGEK